MNQITDSQFEIIYNNTYDSLYTIAFSYVLNKFDAEDIVQDVFIKLYRARKEFSDEQSLKYWLIRVTINKCIDFLRHKKHTVRLFDNDEYINNLPDTSNLVSSSNNKNEEIRKCVLSLKESYKTVIILRYYDNYSIKEMACILKISETNVNVRLNRAKTKLKKMIEERRQKNGG